MNIAVKIASFYWHGFRFMKTGRTLWLIIILKLIIYQFRNGNSGIKIILIQECTDTKVWHKLMIYFSLEERIVDINYIIIAQVITIGRKSGLQSEAKIQVIAHSNEVRIITINRKPFFLTKFVVDNIHPITSSFIFVQILE